MSALRRCRTVMPIVALLGASVAGALAQVPLKPWPDQQPPQQQQPLRAWPGDAQQQQAAAPPSAPPMAPMGPMAPMSPAPQMGAPAGFGAPPSGEAAECLKEFNRMRGEVEKQGTVAKAVQDRKGTREEMCSAITGIHAAQVRWLKFTQANHTRCGIPQDAVKQLKLGESNLAKVRKNICSGGPATAAAPPTPSLAEALGTSRLPASSNESAPKRGGVLDTLTGTAVR